jgi:hypothetical protein
LEGPDSPHKASIDDFKLTRNSSSTNVSRGKKRDMYPKGAWMALPTGRQWEGTDILLSFSEGPKWSRSSEFKGDWSHATTFGREPFSPGFGIQDKYTRDPLTGCWHTQKPQEIFGAMKQDRVMNPLPALRGEMNTMNNVCQDIKRQPMFHGFEQRAPLIRPGCK